MAEIPDQYRDLRIHKEVVDLNEGTLSLPKLDGILMANSLHFIRHQAAFLRRLWCKVTECRIITAMAGTGRVEALFNGRQFDQEIIVLCVRWYLPYKLSTRDLVEMMAERGVILAHTTILRWVQRYVPEFEKCWNRYARPVGGSWRCDETYIKVKGRWTYLYRAVDKARGGM